MTERPPIAGRTRGPARAIGAIVLALIALAAIGPAGAAAIELRGLAGTGALGWTGDGGPATAATLASPSAAATQGDGGLLVADTGNHRIRRIAPDGTITTVVGNGPCCGTLGGDAGDGLQATDPAVRLNGPRGVAALPDGGIVIADTANHVVRAVTPDGKIGRLAGTGNQGLGSDGQPALAVSLNAPRGVAVAADGAILVADTGNHRVLRIDPVTTVATRVAGIAFPTVGGYSGDGGAAIVAQLDTPSALAPRPDGGFLIADSGNDRIREVDATGTIRTVAGAGPIGLPLGDGGPATQATLAGPEGVALAADGTMLIADTAHARVRAVTPGGVISTLAGDGVAGDAGDGGPPQAARVSLLRGVAVGPRGPVLVDTENHRLREIVVPPTVFPSDPPLPPPPAPVPPPELRRSAVAGPLSGRVRIRVPGARSFVRAGSALNVPMGTEVDATDGRVELRFVTTRGGRTATVVASGGRFVVRQPAERDGGQHPGELVLSGPLRHCPKPARRSGSTARRGGKATARATKPAKKRKQQRGRRLTVDARGKIKTRGKYGAAIVRGTRWTIVDRCRHEPRPGTLVTVRSGRVVVDAFRLKTRKTVRAGRSYLAPATRRR